MCCFISLDCGGGGNDSGAVVAAIMIFLFALMLIVGVFIAIYLGCMLVAQVVDRHLKVLHLKEEVKRQVVRDFRGHEHELELDEATTVVELASVAAPLVIAEPIVDRVGERTDDSCVALLSSVA